MSSGDLQAHSFAECRNCGTPISMPGERNCLVCGEPIGSPVEPEYVEQVADISDSDHDETPSLPYLVLMLLASGVSFFVASEFDNAMLFVIGTYCVLVVSSTIGDPSSVMLTRRRYGFDTRIGTLGLLTLSYATVFLALVCLGIFFAVPLATISLFFPELSPEATAASSAFVLPTAVILAASYGVIRVSSVYATLMGFPPYVAIRRGASGFLNFRAATVLCLATMVSLTVAVAFTVGVVFSLPYATPIILFAFMGLERKLLLGNVVVRSLVTSRDSLPPYAPLVDGSRSEEERKEYEPLASPRAFKRMFRCPKCLTPLESHARFCVMCGRQLRRGR